MKRFLAILAAALLALWTSVAGLILHEAARSASGDADVAIVLGAALRVDGSPSPVLEGRLEHGLALYRSGRVKRLLFTGGRGESSRTSEAASARRWAMTRGVPASAILTEERSRTTRQNLVEAGRLMRAANMERALVVSDPLHLPRAMRMARDLGIAAEPSPTPMTRYRSCQSRGPFLLRETYFLMHSRLFRA